MKTLVRQLILIAAVACLFLGPGRAVAAGASGNVRVLLVTGGHEYETNQFLQLFRDNPNLTITHVTHPQAQAWFAADKAGAWDVAVLYDMWQNIDDATKADFLARLKEGKGLVVTHHAIANYQNWPEYERIIGAKYYLAATVRDGVPKARSQYQHDVDFKLKVADPNHPVTRGVPDFMIHDETYNLFDVAPDVTVLLTTDAPTSAPKLCWAKSYGPARVVYLQLGHDHQAWVNPNYQKVLANAIQWTAKRD